MKDLTPCVEKSTEADVAVDIGQAAFTTTLNLLASTFFSVDLGDHSSEFAHEFRKTTSNMIEELGKPNITDYFPILQKIDTQGIRRRTSFHFGKIMGLFKTMIDQQLQRKMPSGSIPGNDVSDSLLGINQEKTEEIGSSKIPNLLLVCHLLFFPKFLLKIALRFFLGFLQNLDEFSLQDFFGGGIDTTTKHPRMGYVRATSQPTKT